MVISLGEIYARMITLRICLVSLRVVAIYFGG
jgi:hypothetical protein